MCKIDIQFFVWLLRSLVIYNSSHKAKGVHNHNITIVECRKFIEQSASCVIGVLVITGIIMQIGVHLSHQRYMLLQDSLTSGYVAILLSHNCFCRVQLKPRFQQQVSRSIGRNVGRPLSRYVGRLSIGRQVRSGIFLLVKIYLS